MSELEGITIKDYSEDVLNELEDVDEAGGDVQGSIVAKGTVNTYRLSSLYTFFWQRYVIILKENLY